MNRYKSNYFSRKVTYLNFILSILIVMLHSSSTDYLNPLGNGYIISYGVQKFFGTMADVAVPTFFLISAFLFFRNFTLDCYIEKIKRRFFTLIVPYISWCFISFIFYFIISYIGKVINVELITSFDFNKNIFFDILLSKFNPQMWFIRVLFFYILISPIIYILFNNLKKYSIIVILLVYLINLIFDFSYSGVLFWLPIYLFGAYLAMYHKNLIIESKYSCNNRVILGVIFIVIIFFEMYQSTYSQIYYTYRIISPIFVWYCIDIIIYNYRGLFWWNKIGFFIFCSHNMVVRFVRKIIITIIGFNNYWILIGYFISVITTIIIIIIVAKVIKSTCPCIWNIISGGRI